MAKEMQFFFSATNNIQSLRNQWKYGYSHLHINQHTSQTKDFFSFTTLFLLSPAQFLKIDLSKLKVTKPILVLPRDSSQYNMNMII